MGAQRSVIHFNIFYGLIVAAMATLPFTIFFMLPIALLMLTNFILEGNWKLRYQNIISSNSLLFFIALSSLFLLYLIGVFYSSHFLNGLSNLETKLWFFIMPLVIFSSDREKLNRDRCHKLIFIFIISCAIMALGNICYSFIQYINTGSAYYFFYIRATHFPYYYPMHPSYLAMYLTFSFIAALYFVFISNVILRRWMKNVFIISLPLFAIFIYLLQSKAGILVFIFAFFFYILYIINRKKIIIWQTVLFTFLTFLVTFVLLKYEPGPMKRMGVAMHDIYSEMDIHNTDNNIEIKEGSISSRIYIWNSSWKLIMQHLPWGMGTGDVNYVLQQKYLKDNQTEFYTRKLNAHNQYIQTTLALGIFGLTALIAFFLIPATYCIKHKRTLYLAFIVIVLLHLLVESMLETGAGANFIAIFSVLLCYNTIKDNLIN